MPEEHCIYQQSKSPESKKKAGGGGEGGEGEEVEQEVEEEKVRSTRYTHSPSPDKKQIYFFKNKIQHYCLQQSSPPGLRAVPSLPQPIFPRRLCHQHPAGPGGVQELRPGAGAQRAKVPQVPAAPVLLHGPRQGLETGEEVCQHGGAQAEERRGGRLRDLEEAEGKGEGGGGARRDTQGSGEDFTI